jgi:hypothetical protein
MRWLILLTVLAAAAAGATDVYRWVDANGQAHYSDEWRPGAEKIRIETAPGYSAPKRPPASDSDAPPPPPAPAGQYQSLEIVSPAQEEVLWNIEGQLRVSLQVKPALQPGHSLRLFLDGERQDLPEGSTAAQLANVVRGVHTLKAAVLSEKGKTLLESQPTTFVVRQTSIANPIVNQPLPTPRR